MHRRRRIHPAAWCGDWAWDYESRGDDPLSRQGYYRWQPLPDAGQRAADDCRAVIDVLQKMATDAGK